MQNFKVMGLSDGTTIGLLFIPTQVCDKAIDQALNLRSLVISSLELVCCNVFSVKRKI